MNQILTVIFVVALVAGFAYLMLRYEEQIKGFLSKLKDKFKG